MRRAPFISGANATLALCPYPHEIIEYAEFQKQTLFVHQPHPVEKEIFQFPIWDKSGRVVKRSINVFLAGSLDRAYYPLRVRLAQMIEKEEIEGTLSLLL